MPIQPLRWNSSKECEYRRKLKKVQTDSTFRSSATYNKKTQSEKLGAHAGANPIVGSSQTEIGATNDLYPPSQRRSRETRSPVGATCRYIARRNLLAAQTRRSKSGFVEISGDGAPHEATASGKANSNFTSIKRLGTPNRAFDTPDTPSIRLNVGEGPSTVMHTGPCAHRCNTWDSLEGRGNSCAGSIAERAMELTSVFDNDES